LSYLRRPVAIRKQTTRKEAYAQARHLGIRADLKLTEVRQMDTGAVLTRFQARA
jgi:hypothetical protein